jgi:fermentation-respiration switch protein FrsA (DUF1100 family)
MPWSGPPSQARGLSGVLAVSASLPLRASSGLRPDSLTPARGDRLVNHHTGRSRHRRFPPEAPSDGAPHAGGAALYPQTLTKCFTALIQPDSFGRLAPADLFRTLSPALDLFGQSDPERLMIKTPLFIAQGTADPIVLARFTDELYRDLTAIGARIECRRYAGKDHFSVVPATFKDAFSFTRRHLKR